MTTTLQDVQAVLNQYNLLYVIEAARKLGIDVDSISNGADFEDRLYTLIGDQANLVSRKIESDYR